MPTSGELKSVLRKVAAYKETIDGVRVEINATITRAEADKGFHRAAGKLAAKLDGLEPEKLAAFLAHFDAYREHLQLDAKADTDMIETVAERKKRAKKSLEEAEQAGKVVTIKAREQPSPRGDGPAA